MTKIMKKIDNHLSVSIERLKAPTHTNTARLVLFREVDGVVKTEVLTEIENIRTLANVLEEFLSTNSVQ